MKRHFTVLIFVTGLCSGASFATNPATEKVTSLRGDHPIEQMNQLSKLKSVPKNQEKFALNYVNQPPLIPHGIQGYQVNASNNTCLDCHDVDHYRKTGAPRISPTHFMDRDNKLLTQVAARRYFCLQCHVPQVQDKPIVNNEFKPTAKFGQ